MRRRFARLPLRVRLIAGFSAAMVVVLIGAGAFVFWRVQFALDHRINDDLASQAADLQTAARQDPATAFSRLGDQGRTGQLLRPDGRVFAAGGALVARPPLLTTSQTSQAARRELRATIGGPGTMLTGRGRHVRILALPGRTGAGEPIVVVASAALNQRDEALRELLGQLVLANLAALLLASFVGYRLTRAALEPVERYRRQAAQITAGATGLRLDVDPGRDDEITRLGTTLNAMLAEQARAAQRLQQFVDDASHELRTPLTILSADVELALRKPRSAAELEATLRRIAVDTAHLVQLSDELLELSALGERPPQRGPIAAHELLEAAARRARGQWPEGTARTVRVEVPAGLVLHGDELMLERALGNLVDNAVRYGGPAITLTAHGAAIGVHDDGPGMRPEFLAQASERFRRSDASRSSPGNGLGLALVAAIAGAHGGQLRICSGGHHHAGATADPALAVALCKHPRMGTTITLLLGPGHPAP